MIFEMGWMDWDLSFHQFVNYEDYCIWRQKSDQIRLQTCVKSFDSFFFVYMFENIIDTHICWWSMVMQDRTYYNKRICNCRSNSYITVWITFRNNWSKKHIVRGKLFVAFMFNLIFEILINKEIDDCIKYTQNRSCEAPKKGSKSFLNNIFTYLFHHLSHYPCNAIIFVMFLFRMEKLNHSPCSDYPNWISNDITDSTWNNRWENILFPFWVVSSFAPFLDSLINWEK